MAEIDQYKQALLKAHANGDTEAANLFASKIKGIQSQPQEVNVAQQDLPEIGAASELNAFSWPAFKASAGLMVTDNDESSKKLLKEQFGDDVSFKDSDQGVIASFPSGDYYINKKGLSGQDIIKFASDMLAYTPAGRAKTILGALGKSALTEAALETSEQSLGGEDISGKDIAISGGIGGFFKGFENLIGAGYRALKGELSETGAELIEQGAKSGIPVTTSDVLPPKTFVGKAAQQTGEKIPFAGTGAMREGQQELRAKAVQDVAEKYGQFSYKSIVESLKSKKNRVKSAAGSVLENTGNKLDQFGEIPLTNTKAAIIQAKEELTKKGVIQSGGAIDDLATLTEAMSSSPQTFTTLKENRTAFREIVAGADKAERSQLTSRAKGLLTRVESAMTKDMNQLAKDNLTPQEFLKWKKANSVYASEANKLTKTRLKNVLDKGDVTPEAVETLLFSQKPSELKNLYSSLGVSGRENARAAIISKVVNNVSKRVGGITPNSFATELKKFGPQVNVFFKGEERKALDGLQKALDATRRAQDAAISTPTGQQLIGAATLASAATDLGATILIGGTTGGIARLYESAPVRNALLRLSSAPKGSTQFEKALLEFQTILNSAAQASKNE